MFAVPFDALLLHPPPYLHEGRDPFGRISYIVPVGLHAVATHLDSRGFRVTLARLGVLAAQHPQPMTSASWDTLLGSLLARRQAPLVAIQCHWSQYAEGARDVAERVRRLAPATRVVLGGVHAAALAEDLLREVPAVDAVIVGEGELPLEKLVRDWEGAAAVPGVWRRGPSGEIVAPPSSSELLPPAEVPLLEFDGRLLDPPEHPVHVGVPIVRGACPKPCSYCELNRRDLFPRKQTVLRDRLGAQLRLAARASVPVYLPENFIGARPLAELIEDLAASIEGQSAPIYVDTHPDMLDDAVIDALGALAARAPVRLWLGLESGSAAVRERAGRRYDAARVFHIRDRLLERGVRPQASFLVGLPGEGAAELAETGAWIERWNDAGLYADVFPALAFPGTSLHRDAAALGLTRSLEGARGLEILSRAWFAPIAPAAVTHENGRLSREDVVVAVLRFRLTQRKRLRLPLTSEALTLMGHRGAPWTRADWASALQAIDPHWPEELPKAPPTDSLVPEGRDPEHA